jgi:hypothetical protein
VFFFFNGEKAKSLPTVNVRPGLRLKWLADGSRQVPEGNEITGPCSFLNEKMIKNFAILRPFP